MTRLAPLLRNLSGRVVALALVLALGCGSDKHRVLEVKVAPHGKASAKLSSGIASFFSGSGSVELEGGDTGSSARYESWPCRCRPKDGGTGEPKP